MDELLKQLRDFGPARLAAIVGVGIGAAVFLSMAVLRVTTPSMAVLYADLSFTEAQEIAARLDQEGVKYEMRERAGSVAILTQATDQTRLRIQLAGDGFVPAEGVGYEIFDTTDTFGATTFQQNINRLRALEGELARTIASIAGVRSARVHLVLPERELFAREEKAASASIVVNAPAGLDKRSVRAIVNLAASAVPELTPSNVTVLDAAGELLIAGGDDDLIAQNSIDERVAATETRLKRTVEDLVGRIVGPDNVRVEVAAELDFNRVTENAEIIDPDSQTVLSSTLIEESANDRDPALARGVTIANALPSAATVDPAAAGAASSSNQRTEEVTNYEISRTVRNEVREQGGVKRLSVAVALATPSEVDANGITVAAPRSEEELARIRLLVASAIGFRQQRGDVLEVVEAPFQPSEVTPALQGTGAAASTAPPLPVMRLIELAALALVALAVIYFVIRPLALGASKPASTEIASQGEQEPVAIAPPAPSPLAEKLDLTRIDGQLKESSVRQVSEIVNAHTEQSVGILKSWIREAS